MHLFRQSAIGVNLKYNNRRDRRVTQRKEKQKLKLNGCSKFQSGEISIKTINKNNSAFPLWSQRSLRLN